MKVDIKKIAEKLELSLFDKGEDVIELCKQWYRGNVKDFHSYNEFMGKQTVTRERYSLGMAKVGCEIWADSIYNPETFVIMEDKTLQEWLDDKFESLNFTANFNSLVEMYFALGLGATVQRKDKEGRTFVDFVYSDNAYPYESENDQITSCLFISLWDDDVIYVNNHKKNDNGTYTVSNIFFRVENEEYTEIEYEEVEKEFVSKVKLFQTYKPAIVNNKQLGSPMGLSILANAINELKTVDQAYDGLKGDMVDGKMTVYLKEGAIDWEVDGGKTAQVIDPNQSKYYVLQGDDTFEDGTFIKVVSPDLRVDSYINGLEASMNLFGRKLGLGDNQFYSENGTIYTNTAQVVSTNSKFFKTRRKHCTIVEKGLKELVKALYYLEFDSELESTISVQFDDSIIHDEKEENGKWLTLLNQGHISRITYFENVMNMTREEATAFDKLQLEEVEDEIEMEE